MNHIESNPIKPPQTFTVLDSREFDGDPYDVAQRAVQQTAGIVKIASESLDNAVLMVRNAEFERQLTIEGDADNAAWEASALYKHVTEAQKSLGTLERRLKAVAAAAGYNPKGRV